MKRFFSSLIVLLWISSQLFAAISGNMGWEVRQTGNDANGGGFRGWCATTPSAPSVSTSASGGGVANGTYYVVITYVDWDNNESPMSSQTSITTTGTGISTITITVPSNIYSQSSQWWNIYVGTTSGGPYFWQNASAPISLPSGNRIITTTPPTTGTQPPGVDRSQQDSPQVTIDNSSITATTTGAASNIITFTAGYTPTANDIGNCVNMSAGTNINAGVYEITAWTSTTWTVTGAQNLTTGGGAGSALIGKMGGGFATPGYVCGFIVANNTVFVKYNGTAYTLSSSNNVSGGNINKSISNCNWIGFDTNRTFINTDANRPQFNATANSMTIATIGSGILTIANIIFAPNTHTSVVGLNVGGGQTTVRNCYANGCDTGFTTSSQVNFHNCKTSGGTHGFVANGGNVYCDFCFATTISGIGFDLNGTAMAYGCIAKNCTQGFKGAGTFCLFCNCSSWTNTSGCNGFQTGVSGPNASYINCIAWGNNSSGTFGYQTGSANSNQYHQNCAQGNWTANSGFVDGSSTPTKPQHLLAPIATTLTVDPFTNAGSDDFSLNTTAGGGALLRALGFPAINFAGTTTTANYSVGAAQIAGTSTPIRPVKPWSMFAKAPGQEEEAPAPEPTSTGALIALGTILGSGLTFGGKYAYDKYKNKKAA